MSRANIAGAKLVAEVQARYVRQLLGADRVPYMDLVDALERTRLLGRIKDFPLVEDHWLPDADARWDPDRKLIIIRREVYEDLTDGDARSRFTVAHELGHCWLGHKFSRNRSLSPELEFGRQRQADERTASHFASQFLVPDHLLPKQAVPVRVLCERFGISRDTAKIRAEGGIGSSPIELAGSSPRRRITESSNQPQTTARRIVPIP